MAKLCDIEELHETEKLLAELGEQAVTDVISHNVKVNEQDSTLLLSKHQKSAQARELNDELLGSQK